MLCTAASSNSVLYSQKLWLIFIQIFAVVVEMVLEKLFLAGWRRLRFSCNSAFPGADLRVRWVRLILLEPCEANV